MKNRFDDRKTYIIDKLFEGYNREINTLWQRSVFLAAFITGVAVIYGNMLEKAIGLKSINRTLFLSYTVMLSVVSLIGILLSLLWIFMSKASKANCEIYELKIGAMSKKFEIDAVMCTEKMDKDSFIDETGVEPSLLGHVNHKIVAEYIGYTSLPENKFFSLNAGPYSVSRINILLGYIFLIFWFVILSLHLQNWVVTINRNIINSCQNYIENSFGLLKNYICCSMVCFALVLLVILIVYRLFGRILESTYLYGER